MLKVATTFAWLPLHFQHGLIGRACTPLWPIPQKPLSPYAVQVGLDILWYGLQFNEGYWEVINEGKEERILIA